MSCGEPTVFWTHWGKQLHAAVCPVILSAVRQSHWVGSYDYCKDAAKWQEKPTFPPDGATLHSCLKNQHLGKHDE